MVSEFPLWLRMFFRASPELGGIMKIVHGCTWVRVAIWERILWCYLEAMLERTNSRSGQIRYAHVTLVHSERYIYVLNAGCDGMAGRSKTYWMAVRCSSLSALTYADFSRRKLPENSNSLDRNKEVQHSSTSSLAYQHPKRSKACGIINF